MWLFLMVPWVGPQCVNVLFPDHTHLFLNRRRGIIGNMVIRIRELVSYQIYDGGDGSHL